jgi:NAD(P)-dependent dehydrogenase (short-subunit alcohol dehydrogenase family)
MPRRVEGKVAIIVGGGQTPGETMGNGRATAMVLAREGAQVVVVDRRADSAEDTAGMIQKEGGQAVALETDATNEESITRLMSEVLNRFGHIDILHNNVGASIALGDAPADELTEEAFDRAINTNLKSHWLAIKHALPALRQSHGSIVCISSLAAITAYPLLGYKTTKMAIVGMIEQIAAVEAKNGVRINAILPGHMNTPMAIEARVAQGRMTREQVIASRDALVPLGGKQGTAWDVAYAALFLHSDEARFITGVSLPVDGGERISH